MWVLNTHFHVLRVIYIYIYYVFPLLVLKGTYHYWTYFCFSRGLNQMEVNVKLEVGLALKPSSCLALSFEVKPEVGWLRSEAGGCYKGSQKEITHVGHEGHHRKLAGVGRE